MALKSNSSKPNVLHTIPDGWVIFLLCCLGGGAFFCGNFFAEYQYDKKETKLHRTIDSLNKLLPIPTKYVHVTDVRHIFFPIGQVIYMGWIYKPDCNNIYKGLTLDTTAYGDSIPINGKNCKHALGMFAQPHDRAWVVYTLEKRCSEFKADIVLIIPKEHAYGKDTIENYFNKTLSKNGAGVIFRVYGDDNPNPMYEDSIIAYNKPKKISINIDTVNKLKLEVQSIKLGYYAQNSCWANARVIVK